MGYGGFSVPCRVGNWAEDEYLGVLQTHSHQQKSSVGMLTSQQLGSVIGAAMTPVTLAPSPADGCLRYGDRVMLSAAPDLGGVLAVDGTNTVEISQEAYVLTRTRAEGGVACTRTAFTIVADGEPPADGIVRIGDKFCLVVDAGSAGTLYLASERYTLHNQNYSPSPGLPGHQGCFAKPSKDLWEVKVLDPSDLAQMESVGQPVPANTFISLVHVNTCTALSTGTAVVKNKYGGEYEVTTFTATPITKGAWGKRNGSMLGAGNHWAFTTSDVAAAAPPAAES